MLSVQFDDLKDAVPRVRAVLQPTPLIPWPGLAQLAGCDLYLKHENHQPVGAFKVRGGVNLVAQLRPDERESGILGVSTGNHGQSLAYAARRAGVACTIVVPRRNNPDKVRAIRLLGAEILEHGDDFNEAKTFAEDFARTNRVRYVHSANEPHLIAGVGTMGLEILEALPDPDFILVPIGLGSGACGTAIAAKTLSPRTQVIGVQAAGAPAVARSWQTGRWETTLRAATWAEGMATREPAEMTLEILRALLDDVILVEEDALRRSVRHILRETHNLAEGAGAASLAAVLAQPQRFAGRKVVAVLSGGNLDLAELPGILALPEE